MVDIRLNILFGNELRHVEIFQPSLWPGQFHIMIDGFFIGQIIRRQGQLDASLNPYPDLTGDDLQIIFDLIEEAEKKDQK